MQKILCVDDELDMEELIRQKFRRKIRKKEVEFLFAHDGTEALDVLDDHQDVGIILSDINMPGMDGLTLLDRLKEKELDCKTVMVSAYGDMDNIRTAMNRGAFDFVMKPINFDDLDTTIEKTMHDLEQIRKAKEEHDKLIKIQQDLDVAKDIQLSFLPKIFPPYPDRKEFDIFASMDAAKSVGGDFYDFFFIGDQKFCFIIGDVSGKGIPAALFMVISKTLLKNEALRGYSPEEILYRVNNTLYPDNDNCMFFTGLCFILDLKTGELEFANAGHNPPLLCKNGSNFTYIELLKSCTVGPIPDIQFKNQKINLNPGDKLFLYTDGVTEAMNPQDELFSEQRLETLLKDLKDKTPKEIIEEVNKAVKDFAQTAPQSDDITMVGFQFNGTSLN